LYLKFVKGIILAKKAKVYKFFSELSEMKRGGVGIIFPYNVKDEFGTGGQVKIQAKFDGEPYRGSLAPMGDGIYIVGVKKEIREKINKNVGDMIEVEIFEDTEPRIVDVPKDFEKALKKGKGTWEIFEKFAYTHKKEYVRWINEAKKEKTRLRRIDKAVIMISKGEKFS